MKKNFSIEIDNDPINHISYLITLDLFKDKVDGRLLSKFKDILDEIKEIVKDYNNDFYFKSKDELKHAIEGGDFRYHLFQEYCDKLFNSLMKLYDIAKEYLEELNEEISKLNYRAEELPEACIEKIVKFIKAYNEALKELERELQSLANDLSIALKN